MDSARGGTKRVWISRIAIGAVALGAWSAGNQGSATGPASSAASTPVAERQSPTPTRSFQTTTAPAPVPDAPPENEAVPTTAAAREDFAVQSITDGDTLTLADGRRVRLAQVDAPETNECFGSQSTRALRALVEGRSVTLRRPSNGPEKDRYGRTLAEVSVGDESVNERLVADGASEWYEEFTREDPDLAARLRSAEREAKAAGRGLWSNCAGRVPDEKPASANHAVMPSSGSCHPAYPDDCIPPPAPDLDCADINRRVRVELSYGDPHRFDANQDGWGCESYG